MFASKLNTMTGRMDWEILDEDYDYQQELARAGFADMLHDFERNKKYYEGLKKVIKKLKSENKYVHVLDIGTGTGLLSMMAVRCGADKVTACEAFKPMVQVAKKCIEANGMAGRIDIIEKRSTEIVVGVDMAERANLLVTEVFDTELIGEGAISTFSHALEHLLVKDCHVIPDNATIYIQLVDSRECRDWNWLSLAEKYDLSVPNEYANLAGDAVFDVQLSQFESFAELSEPLEAFTFSFSGKQPALLFENERVVKAVSKRDGTTDAIFMWWILNMDFENEIKLSCAPKWQHHDPSNMAWRDHWMQAIYYPKTVLRLSKDETFYVKCNHDEYSLYFDLISSEDHQNKMNSSRKNYTIEKFIDDRPEESQEREERSLGVTIVSRNRLAQLNDPDRNDFFLRLLNKYSNQEKSILIANDDFSVCPFLFAKHLNFKKIYVLESNRLRQKCMDAFILANNLAGKIQLIPKCLHELEVEDLKNVQFDIIFSELSFNQALLPWDNLYFFYGLEHLKQLNAKEFYDEKVILPQRIRLKAAAVHLVDLDKIRSPVVETEGFDLTEFDKVILESSRKSDGFMEPHPLWEYPCIALSDQLDVFSFEFANGAHNENTSKQISIEIKSSDYLPNGVCVWHLIDYSDESSINTGPIEPPIIGKKLEWSKAFKQAVHILDKKYEISNASNRANLIFNLNFRCNDGSFNFIDFRLNQ